MAERWDKLTPETPYEASLFVWTWLWFVIGGVVFLVGVVVGRII